MVDGEVSWVKLAELMVRRLEREPTLRGSIRSYGSRGWSDNSMSWVSPGRQLPPVFTGVTSPGMAARTDPSVLEQVVSVWHDGAKVRVEMPAGTPWKVSDGNRTWTMNGQDGSALVSEGRELVLRGSGTHLLRRRTAADVAALGEPTGPIQAVTLVGRDGWAVRLQAVDGSGSVTEIVVDAATGLLLRQHDPATGAVDEWVELSVGEELDPAVFVHTGPSRSAEQARRDDQVEHQREVEQLQQRFRDRVTAEPLRFEVVDEMTVSWVPTWDDATGEFEAVLTSGTRGGRGGNLARRPHSDEPWQLRWAADHRWSTTRWDWALTLYGTTLTPDSLRRLQDQLGDTP